MKFWISFGQIHTHSIGVHTIDKDCIVEVEAPTRREAHENAMEMFNKKFFTVYDKLPNMKHFPRGVIKL